MALDIYTEFSLDSCEYHADKTVTHSPINLALVKRRWGGVSASALIISS